MCSSTGGQKLYYTVSGIITPIGGRPVHGTAATASAVMMMIFRY